MKEILITTCLLFSCLILYATEPILTKEKKSEKTAAYSNIETQAPYNRIIYQEQGFFIEASPGVSSIKNKNLSSDIWNPESNLGYNFNLGFFRSVTPWVKIKLGLGFSSYSTHLKGDGEINSPEFTDIDGDTYIESLTLSNIDYSINPMYLTVPIIFELGNPNINKVGYYIDFGLEYSFLVSENNSTSGSYTAKGIYPQWGVTLEDIPELGFYSARNLDSQWSLPKSNYSLKGGAGITIPLSGIVIFKIGVAGYLGLKDIGNKQAQKNDSEVLSQEAFAFRSRYTNNPLISSNGTKTLFTGIEFGFYISKRVK